jgi:hypothetical protein
MHCRIAAMIKIDPEAVIGKARSNLNSWMARREGAASQAAMKEWLELLESLAPEELASFIVSESECATRMRQNSPFAGVLTPQEIWAIKRGNEAA